MPHWKTHLEIGKRCNDFLKYNDNDLMLFLFGNILPDINNLYIIDSISKKVDRNLTHFKNKDNLNYINFYNKYKDKINNPLVLGYYCHLFTDYYWNNYSYNRLNKDDKFKNFNKDEIRIFKQNEFKKYSDLYDNNINITNIDLLINELKNIDEVSINEDDINKVINYLSINESNKKLKYFTKDEFNLLLNKTIEELNNKIKNQTFK